MDSYTAYLDGVGNWWRDKVDPGWRELRDEAMEILHREDRLQQIVKLVGPDALPDDQRLILLTAYLLKEGFLQQNALDEVDTYALPTKQVKLLRTIIHFHRRAAALIEKGCPVVRVREMPIIPKLLRLKSIVPNDRADELDKVLEEINHQMNELEREYRL